jgi:hypothetical protein
MGESSCDNGQRRECGAVEPCFRRTVEVNVGEAEQSRGQAAIEVVGVISLEPRILSVGEGQGTTDTGNRCLVEGMWSGLPSACRDGPAGLYWRVCTRKCARHCTRSACQRTYFVACANQSASGCISSEPSPLDPPTLLVQRFWGRDPCMPSR